MKQWRVVTKWNHDGQQLQTALGTQLAIKSWEFDLEKEVIEGRYMATKKDFYAVYGTENLKFKISPTLSVMEVIGK